MTEIDTVVGHNAGVSCIGPRRQTQVRRHWHSWCRPLTSGTVGDPIVAANVGGNNQAVEYFVVKGTTNLGAEIGGTVWVGVGSAPGFTDQGMLLPA